MNLELKVLNVTPHIAKDGLELQSLCLHITSFGITGLDQLTQLDAVLGLEPRLLNTFKQGLYQLSHTLSPTSYLLSPLLTVFCCNSTPASGFYLPFCGHLQGTGSVLFQLPCSYSFDAS